MGPTVVHEDNQGCIAISSNNRTDSRTKHIDVKYHFVRDMVQAKEITVQHISTENMLVDFLTKPSTASKFKFCCDKLLHDNGMCLRGCAEIKPTPLHPLHE
jgi:hypothetical protein